MKNLTLSTLCTLIILSNTCYAADMSDWSTYADSLQNCTPGTYNLPDPVMQAVGAKNMMISYEIVGMNAGNCEIKISRSITLPGQAQPTTLTLDCMLTSDNISVLSKGAKDLSSGTATLSTNDPAASILKSACKRVP